VAAAQAVQVAIEHAVETADGTPVRISAESICCHGDTPGAVDIAAAVRRGLERAGVAISAVGG
jgi:UPF0271 protein